METSQEQLNKMRHSLAHILAYAVQEIYPKVKFGIGPAIEDGFYYDFGNLKLSSEDLPKIEKKMKELLKQDIVFEKREISKEQVKKMFEAQPYKLELIEDLSDDEISIYKSGNFVDLCKGPHIKSTKEINPDSFKLLRVAGAYWKGSEKNPMLTRIYGVGFSNPKELEDYLKLQEEAAKRDHRKLGKELELFMSDERVGQGLVMFLPKGAFIYKKLEDYMYQKEFEWGYHYVRTPVLAQEELYKKSGHLAHYKDDMYRPIEIEGKNYYLKPMNCPHHHIMFKHSPKSYRDLPYRLADFGMIHRYERSGVLTGLIRTRNFCQNDAHIYCSKEQVKSEFINVLKLFDEVYKDFHIKDYWFELSLPDYNNKEKFGDIQNKEMWEYSANIAREAMKEYGAKFVEVEGEAAFYGPKADVQIKNVFGKKDTIATIQIDFYMPEKFDLTFVNKNGEKERPVIIHRAIMGSFERFFAFLIEQTGGAFPVWLSPTQVYILPVGEKHQQYAEDIAEKLKEKNIRVEVKEEETISKRIRDGEKQKIPYILVVGDKEVEAKTIQVRQRSKGDIGTMKLEEFIQKIEKDIKEKN